VRVTVPLTYYLLVFDHDQQKLVSMEEFTDPETASSNYEELERTYRGDDGFEVVLVGSDSIETIKLTHGNYFSGSVASAARRAAELTSK
jgi:hypothetical protein